MHRFLFRLYIAYSPRRFICCICLLSLFVANAGFATAATQDRQVFIYYYAWYGNPEFDGGWLHWQEFGHTPPWDLGTSYYPRLGPYSSRDPAVIRRHMQWIAGAGIHAIIYSWWGEKDFTDSAVPAVLDAAAEQGLKVCFMIEPYAGRTIFSIDRNIRYIKRNYSQHEAYFRTKDNGKGWTLIFQPRYSDAELHLLNQRAPNDTLILLQSTDAGLPDRTGADGIFAYEAVLNIGKFYKGIARAAKKRGKIFLPCVSPGFDTRRALRDTPGLHRSRRNGKRYDLWWEHALAANTDSLAILSFNEWHEGTQIEPAIVFANEHLKYADYENAYGKTGVPAETSYLRRTQLWINRFLQKSTTNSTAISALFPRSSERGPIGTT